MGPKRCTQKIESEHFPNFPQRYPLTKMLFFTNFGNFRRFCEGTTEHTIRALWSGCEPIQLLNTFSTSICFIPGVKSVLSVSKSNVLRRKTQCFVFCLKINYSPRCLDKLFSNFFLSGFPSWNTILYTDLHPSKLRHFCDHLQTFLRRFPFVKHDFCTLICTHEKCFFSGSFLVTISKHFLRPLSLVKHDFCTLICTRQNCFFSESLLVTISKHFLRPLPLVKHDFCTLICTRQNCFFSGIDHLQTFFVAITARETWICTPICTRQALRRNSSSSHRKFSVLNPTKATIMIITDCQECCFKALCSTKDMGEKMTFYTKYPPKSTTLRITFAKEICSKLQKPAAQVTKPSILKGEFVIL